MPRSRLCWSDPSPSFGTQAEKIKGGWQTYHVQRKLVKGEARRGPEWVRGREPSFRASTALPPPLQPSLGGLSLPSKHPLIGAGFNSFLLLRAKHTRLSPSAGGGGRTTSRSWTTEGPLHQPPTHSLAWDPPQPAPPPWEGPWLPGVGVGGNEVVQGQGLGSVGEDLGSATPRLCDLRQAAALSEPSPYCEGVTGLVPNPSLEHPWPRSRRAGGPALWGSGRGHFTLNTEVLFSCGFQIL